jgi:peptidylprolyl isomerase
MNSANHRDKVLVHYTGRMLDGRVVESSSKTGAVELQLGNGSVPPGLERAIVGMKAGETKSTLLRAKEAFGMRRRDLILRLDANEIPPDAHPRVGEVLTMQNSEGATLRVQVTEVTDSEIVVDGNHPLAGLDVTFDIELVRILDNTPVS